VHDLRDALLTRAVGAADEHTHIGACDAAGQLDNALHRIRGEYNAAKIVLLRQTLAPAALFFLQSLVLARRLRQLQEILDRRQQLVIIPGLADVIRRARLDQLHRGFQMRPRRQQHHGQIGLLSPQRTKQRRALFSRGGIGAEVHVGDDEVNALVRQRREPFLRREGRQRADVVQAEQQRQRLGDRRVVIYHQYRTHRDMLTGAGRNHTPTALIRRGSPMQGEWKPRATPATARQIDPATE